MSSIQSVGRQGLLWLCVWTEWADDVVGQMRVVLEEKGLQDTQVTFRSVDHVELCTFGRRGLCGWPTISVTADFVVWAADRAPPRE